MRFGQMAEDAAALFLERKGYTILKRNYRTRWAEIDIIASHVNNPNQSQQSSSQLNYYDETLVFIEVKARNSTRHGLPSEAVSVLKQQKIISAATQYIREHNIVDKRIRFDVLTILFKDNLYHIELIPNAFQSI